MYPKDISGRPEEKRGERPTNESISRDEDFSPSALSALLKYSEDDHRRRKKDAREKMVRQDFQKRNFLLHSLLPLSAPFLKGKVCARAVISGAGERRR